MPPTEKDLRVALARAVATRKVPDDVVASVASKLAHSKLDIRGIDICVYGICLDYVFDGNKWREKLEEIAKVPDARVRGIEVFPWGIPFPDIFRVRVQHEFQDLNRFIEDVAGPARR
jgi:predicted kinase